jgi:PAS domain S-box-containing protein
MFVSVSPDPATAPPPLPPGHLAAILGSVDDGIIVTDATGRVRFVNDSAARIARFEGDPRFRAAPFDALISQYDFFDTEGAPVAPQDLPTRRALRGEGAPQTVLRLRDRETNREEWWVVRVTVLRDASGALDAVVAHFRDITAQRHAREREQFLAEASALLAESLDYAETLQRVADLAVRVIADWCGVDILTANGALQSVAIAHVDPEKVALAREFQRRYPPDLDGGSAAMAALRAGRPLLVPEVTEAMVAASAVDAEHLRLLRALGMRSVLVLPLVARGRALGRMTLISSSPERRYGEEDRAFAEELAHRAAVAIDNARLFRDAQASEARYRGLFEGVSDAVLVFDAEGRYIDANRAATELYGESREALLRRRIGDNPAMRAESLASFAQLTREGTFRGETVLQRADGTSVPVESRTTAVRLPDGVIYVTVIRDITERRRAEEGRQRFVAMVAHELRNPLTTIAGYAALMQRRAAYDAKATATILDQARRLERLTLDLREALRAQAGTLTLRREAVSPSDLLATVAEQARTATGRAIIAEIPPDLRTAYWDADRVAQALGNVLLNAVQHTPEGRDVRLHAADTGAAVRITVADEGAGIPPEDLPRIFEPFYRATNAAAGWARGMGLGLPIAKELAEAHGGAITVASTLGAGTTFTFTLPYGEPPAQQ